MVGVYGEACWESCSSCCSSRRGLRTGWRGEISISRVSLAEQLAEFTAKSNLQCRSHVSNETRGLITWIHFVLRLFIFIVAWSVSCLPLNEARKTAAAERSNSVMPCPRRSQLLAFSPPAAGTSIHPPDNHDGVFRKLQGQTLRGKDLPRCKVQPFNGHAQLLGWLIGTG